MAGGGSELSESGRKQLIDSGISSFVINVLANIEAKSRSDIVNNLLEYSQSEIQVAKRYFL